MEERKNHINNNSWSVDHSLSFEEMQDLGVDLLPENSNIQDKTKHLEKKKMSTAKDEPYNDYSVDEAEEFERTKKAKFIKSDNFLYRQKVRMNFIKDVFGNLSDEVVLNILKFLTHCDLKIVAQVSRRFRRLAYDESLWPRLDLAGRTLLTNAMGHILRRGIRVLRMKDTEVNSPIWSKTFDMKLSGFESKLELLDLSDCIICVEDLKKLLSKCRSLKKLSLESCEVTTEVCLEVSQNSNLNTLNLAMCEKITKEGLLLICINCIKLESINLAWTKLSEETCAAFVNNVSDKLRFVNLSGLHASITDFIILSLIRRCRELRELDISDCLDVTSSLLMSFAKELPYLRSLSLSRCYKLEARSIEKILGSMTELRTLNAFRQLNSSNARELEAKYPLLRVNKEQFSTVARPTVGIRRTSIWSARCRE